MPYTRLTAAALVLLALIASGAALHAMQPVLLPFVVALFLSNIFRPFVAWSRKKKIPMALALVAVVVIAGAVLFSVGVIMLSSVQSLIAALPRYEARWNNTLLPGLQHLLDDAPQAMQDQLKNLRWSNIIQVSSILGLIYAGAGGMVSVLSGAALILLFMLFILGSQGLFERKVRAAYPEHAESFTKVLERIDARTERYLITVTLMNLATGLIAFIVLASFGVDLALLWGLITFLVSFIPTIGSIIALVLPIAAAFLQFDSLSTPIAVTIVLAITQFAWGSVITPRVMGASLDLSPLLVLIALIFWGWVWGPWGMVLSVPITALIKIVLESVPATKPIALLMGAKANG